MKIIFESKIEKNSLKNISLQYEDFYIKWYSMLH